MGPLRWVSLGPFGLEQHRLNIHRGHEHSAIAKPQPTMLDARSSILAHVAQDAALVLLSCLFLPLDTFLTFWAYAVSLLYPFGAVKHRQHVRSTHTPYFEPKTILVTGVGMTKGLALARIFYSAGHNVIGADFEPSYLPTACGRSSRALKAFHKFTKPDGTKDGQMRYTQDILNVIRKEQVDIWVSCSGVASAVEDGIAKEMVETLAKCKAVQYDVATTKRLHEKHSFLEDTNGTGKKYIMKYIGTDDSVRGDMTLLPLDT